MRTTIDETIKLYEDVKNQAKILNKYIKEHFEPLLLEAAKAGNIEQFNILMEQIPDCPFKLTAYRIEDLYQLNKKK